MRDKRKSTDPAQHAALVAAWLRCGDTLEARRRRSEFVRAVERNASVLGNKLGVSYDVSRGLQRGVLPDADVALRLALLMRERQDAIASTARALAPDNEVSLLVEFA